MPVAVEVFVYLPPDASVDVRRQCIGMFDTMHGEIIADPTVRSGAYIILNNQIEWSFYCPTDGAALDRLVEWVRKGTARVSVIAPVEMAVHSCVEGAGEGARRRQFATPGFNAAHDKMHEWNCYFCLGLRLLK